MRGPGINSQVSNVKGLGTGCWGGGLGAKTGKLGRRPFPHLFEVGADGQGVAGAGLIGQHTPTRWPPVTLAGLTHSPPFYQRE